jgi:glutamate--cysteine ligase
VRIKKVLEIRAADGNSPAMTGALAAVMRGVLYDATALAEAGRLLPSLTPDAHRALHRAAQVDGLGAKLGAGTLLEPARGLIEVSAAGLKRLGGGDEALLAPLREVAARGTAPAVDVLQHFENEKRPGVFLGRFAV